MTSIYGNMVGGAGLAQTYILEDENGNEIVGVVSDEEVVLDATVNDVREGKTFASGFGVMTGEKEIPAYHTNQGSVLIPAGSEVKISSLDHLDTYAYTKLQAILCDFNTSISDSVSAIKVSIDGHVYDVRSADSLSEVTKNDSDKTIDFGIINETSNPQILRYFTYKEII